VTGERRGAVGIDIGGSYVKLALVDERGGLQESRRWSSESVAAEGADPHPFVHQIVQHVRQMNRTSTAEIAGVGVSIHGYLDPERRGPIICPNTPALAGFDLKGALERELSLPVVLESDLTAHALAEYFYGSGRGSQRFLCLAIGTGLGAGVVIRGEPLRYLGGCAGDTGHIIIQPGGPRCAMGCEGCAEALCGVAGIERLALERTGKAMSAQELITQAREGNPEAGAVIDQIGQWLGLTLASLCSIFLPDRVALTGGISESGPTLLRACERRFYEVVGGYHERAIEMSQGYYHGVDFVIGEMRGQSGVVGAAASVFRPSDKTSSPTLSL
jgi:glucokinase